MSLTFSGSSAIGSGGILRLSEIGSGGVGGRLVAADGSTGGGGIGRATGGGFLPHAPIATARTRIHKADVRLKCILPLSLMRAGPHPRARFARRRRSAALPSGASLRPPALSDARGAPPPRAVRSAAPLRG